MNFLYFVSALKLKINFNMKISFPYHKKKLSHYLIKCIYLQYNNVLRIIDENKNKLKFIDNFT